MISAIVPALNEEKSIGEFYKRLSEVLQKLDKSYEIIFVDDGSTDGTLQILKNLSSMDKNIHIFSFRKNQGKAEALTLGFQKAKGDIIVTLDADLQDRPEEIHKLLEKYKKGIEVVCGWRKNRKDSLQKIISSKLFNKIMGVLWGVNLHDYNCGLKLYSSEAAKSLRLYGGMHRFIPLLVSEQGFIVDEVPIEHDMRKYGESKYGFSKLWRDLPDMFTMLFLTRYGKRPLHFFGLFGAIFALLGTGIMVFFWISHTFFHQSVGDRPLLFIGMICVIAGLQVTFTGFLADMLINLFHKSQTPNGDFLQKHLLKFSNEK